MSSVSVYTMTQSQYIPVALSTIKAGFVKVGRALESVQQSLFASVASTHDLATTKEPAI